MYIYVYIAAKQRWNIFIYICTYIYTCIHVGPSPSIVKPNNFTPSVFLFCLRDAMKRKTTTPTLHWQMPFAKMRKWMTPWSLLKRRSTTEAPSRVRRKWASKTFWTVLRRLRKLPRRNRTQLLSRKLRLYRRPSKNNL